MKYVFIDVLTLGTKVELPTPTIIINPGLQVDKARHQGLAASAFSWLWLEIKLIGEQ